MSSIKLKHSGGNGMIIAAPSSNPAADRTISLNDNYAGNGSFVTANSSGNVGIGTSSPSGKLNLATGASTACELRLTSNNTGSGSGDRGRISVYSSRNDGTAFEAAKIEIDRESGTEDKARIQFFTNGGSGNTERMRINSSGTVLIGTTSSSNSDNALEVRNSNSGGALGVTSSNSSNQQDFILFKVGSGNTANGGIRRDGSTNGVELFSGSDRRIKKNILDMDNVLDKINKLSLKKFDFKQGGSGVGVIAQDLISIFPNKVKKDDSDDGTGDTIPDGVEAWTVGHNFTYELLKAVQELSAKVETLETEKTQMQTDLTALTARVAALEAG